MFAKVFYLAVCNNVAAEVSNRHILVKDSFELVDYGAACEFNEVHPVYQLSEPKQVFGQEAAPKVIFLSKFILY